MLMGGAILIAIRNTISRMTKRIFSEVEGWKIACCLMRLQRTICKFQGNLVEIYVSFILIEIKMERDFKMLYHNSWWKHWILYALIFQLYNIFMASYLTHLHHFYYKSVHSYRMCCINCFVLTNILLLTRQLWNSMSNLFTPQ